MQHSYSNPTQSTHSTVVGAVSTHSHIVPVQEVECSDPAPCCGVQ